MTNIILQPWQKENYDSFGIIRLHEEILDFCNYIRPTDLEEIVRLSVVERIKNLITKRWPKSNVQIFGSFATGLYLPSSDIDIVIFGEWKSNPLKTIEKLILDNNLSTEVRVVSNATVPIVKYVDSLTGIHVDISFNKDNGVQTIGLIKKFIKKFPHLQPIFLVLKQFMLQRDLNEVWTGGVGSYCMMLLCISFMQQYNKEIKGNVNLGCLLIEFFELYGRCFNFISTGISVNGNGFYNKKCHDGKKVSMLNVIDPNDYSNDVGRSCFGVFNIRLAFANAYAKLYSKVIPSCIMINNGSCKIAYNESILASIIDVNADLIKFRECIRNKFGNLVNHDVTRMNIASPIPNKKIKDSIVTKKSIKRTKTKSQTNVKNLRKNKKVRTSWSDLQDWSKDNVFEYKDL